MGPRQDGRSSLDSAMDYCRCTAAAIDVQSFCIPRKHSHTPVGKLIGIHKHTAAIAIRRESPSRSQCYVSERSLSDFEFDSFRALLTPILKAGIRSTPTDPREEAQLSFPYNFHRDPTHLKLALTATIVPTSAEAEVSAAIRDIRLDAAVTGAIERTAVAKVASAGKYKQSASGCPRFGE